jgi:hypothetical protein
MSQICHASISTGGVVKAFFRLISILLAVVLCGASGMAAEQAKTPGITPVVRLDLEVASRSAAKTAMIRDVLPGEIPGIRSAALSLAPGVMQRDSSSVGEDRVYLVLAGTGNFTAGGKKYPAVRETIAHFPVSWNVDIEAGGAQGLDILILYLTLINCCKSNCISRSY